MKLLVIGHDVVTELLTVPACISVMRETMIELSTGTGHQPLRSTVMPPGLDGFLGLMPGYVGGSVPSLGVKLLGIFPGNSAIGKDSHQGVVILLNPATGEPQAVVNATAITAVRTAAVSAVATDALANADASVLAVIGTGFQAQWHVRTIAAVRDLTQVRMTGRDADRGTEVAAALAAETGLDIGYVRHVATALDGAQIVVTATSSATPVLELGWLVPGAHVNAVGACLPHMRELDSATVAASRFIVDRRESALAESGDYRLAVDETGIGPDHIAAELGEVLAGTVEGRRTADELTVFESLGLAVQDLAAAAFVRAKSEGAGRGSLVEF